MLQKKALLKLVNVTGESSDKDLELLFPHLELLAIVVSTIWSVCRISISTMSYLSMRHNLRVVTNNSRAVVNLLGCLLAVLGHYVLALLNISGVDNNIIFLMTGLVVICLALCVILYIISGVTLALLMVVTTMAITRSTLGDTGKKKSSTQFEHHFGDYLPTFSIEQELKYSNQFYVRPNLLYKLQVSDICYQDEITFQYLKFSRLHSVVLLGLCHIR